jgi:hypothetical protein
MDGARRSPPPRNRVRAQRLQGSLPSKRPGASQEGPARPPVLRPHPAGVHTEQAAIYEGRSPRANRSTN